MHALVCNFSFPAMLRFFLYLFCVFLSIDSGLSVMLPRLAIYLALLLIRTRHAAPQEDRKEGRAARAAGS
jgi:hypothetical protein